MNEDNYHSFFGSKTDVVSESEGVYHKKSEIIDILIQAKKSDDKVEIHRLIDEVIRLYGKVLDENIRLKETNSDLKDQLLRLVGNNEDNSK